MNKRKIQILAIDLFVFAAIFLGIVFLMESTALDFFGWILRDPSLVPVYFVSFFAFAAFVFICRFIFRIYRSIWRFAGAMEYLRLVVADFLGAVTFIVINEVLRLAFPSVPFLAFNVAVLLFLLNAFATIGSRLVYQWLRNYGVLVLSSGKKVSRAGHQISVAVVGAGQVGVGLAEEMRLSRSSHYRPLCFVDNDPSKIGQYVEGLLVYDENTFVKTVAHNLCVQEIVIALPNASEEEKSRLYALYSATGCKVKMYDLPRERSSNAEIRGKMREVQIEDLLFRAPLTINDEETRSFYRGKIILVTGGGGSIGSELCRQIAKLSPERLIIFDIYENNAYDIQQELIRTYGDALNLSVEIGSVRDVARVDSVFANYKPQIVFHAAAHKHVPLMEHSGCEAIKNNILGTKNVADAAEKHGAGKFILISTDKAVNPTNIMGASKRMCEMVIQCRVDSKTEFSAVRFGNVLGSNGSVIPLFRRQIEKGGPVTITDKRIIRYFMTIPEASQLVMQAGAMAKRGELFVLDMGKPVRILELAENMIRLSGYEPYEEIDIVEIGLRPGEKLYEELLIKGENLDKTDNDMIFVEQDAPLTRGEVQEKIDSLVAAVDAAKEEIASPLIKEAMMRAVPTYRDPEALNCDADNADEMRAVAASVK